MPALTRMSVMRSPEDVTAELTPSDTVTRCPYKGTASYYSLKVNGAVNPDAVWYYPQPKAAAAAVRDRVAFWKGVTVTQ